MEDVCDGAVIVERLRPEVHRLYESVYGEFEVLLSSQQVMNLAAPIAHC